MNNNSQGILTCLKIHTFPLDVVLNREEVDNPEKQHNVAQRLLGLGESELKHKKKTCNKFL